MSQLRPADELEETLVFLSGALSTALAGRPQLVLLEGDAGVGKTGLLDRLEAEWHRGEAGCRVVRVSPRIHGDSVKDPIGCAASKDGRLRGGRAQSKPPESKRELVLEWLSVVPIFGELAAALAATIDRLRRRSRTGQEDERDPDVANLLRQARRRPLVLLIDSLEEAEESGMGRLEALIRGALTSRARLLVIAAHCTLRDTGMPTPAHRLRRVLPEEVVVHRRIRALTPHAALSGWTSELDRTPGPVLETVRVASVLGDEFDSVTVCRLLNEDDELAVEDRLAVAAHCDLLKLAGERVLADGSMTTVYQFVSPRLRAALAAELSPERRAATDNGEAS